MKVENKKLGNKKDKAGNKKKVNKKKLDSKKQSSSNKNLREIEVSPENIRVVKPNKVTDINNGNKAVKKTASKKKAHKAKKNKQKKPVNPKALKFAKWTSLFIIIIGIAIFICTTPMFNVQKIEVTGNSKLTENEVISLSQISKNDNIFKYSKKKISESIAENAYVKKVTVKKKYPNTIELVVEERQVKACVKVLNSYAYIDDEGYILEISEERNGLDIIEGLVTEESSITVGTRLVKEDLENLSLAFKILEVSKNKGIEDLYSININDGEYIMHLENSKKLVYLGDASNLAYRIDAVKEAINKIPEKQGSLYANGDLNGNFELYFREGEI